MGFGFRYRGNQEKFPSVRQATNHVEQKLDNVNWVNYDNSLQEALSLLEKLSNSEI
jgi:hypothetical protein